jgi:carboxyl-terminal processing protease
MRLITVTRCSKQLWTLFALLLATFLVQQTASAHPEQTFGPRDPYKLLDEMLQTVSRNFYDAKLGGLSIQELRQAAPRNSQPPDWSTTERDLNVVLSKLRTSHTHYYSPFSKGFHELLGVFGEASQSDKLRIQSRYDGIGLETLESEGKLFVRAIWDGFPAAKAGLKVGDRILSVDGQPYQEILSFQGKKSAIVQIQSSGDQPARKMSVQVVTIDPADAWEKVERASATVMQKSGRKIAYIKVWSYAAVRYQEALEELLTHPDLRECQGLVLDIRDGWGGAHPRYLNLFNPNIPAFEMIERQGKSVSFDSQWRKPVVLLVNSGSRSGKEILAYGFKKHAMGKIVGEHTGRAVVGGRPYLLKNGGVLYLAVADVKVDGIRLEGVGVEPDVVVTRPIPFCQGADPQLERALQVCSEMPLSK